MKAAILTAYNKKKLDLRIQDVSMPVPAPGQALLRVLAAGVNPVDNMITRGEVRLITPFKLPQVAGNEVVGVVERINGTGHGIDIGDRVFARLPMNAIGAFAQYVAVDLDALAHVPEAWSNVEAAAVPLTALTAVQALDLMGAKEGESIFISGGTGGLGAMAIPIAAALRLQVYTNGSADNKDRVLGLGAQRFFDYKREDYSEVLRDVDYVLDTIGGAETEKQMKILRRGGRLISLRGVPNGAFAKRIGLPSWKQTLFALAGRRYDKLAAKYHVEYNFLYVTASGAQLAQATEWLLGRGVRPSLDAVYPFARVNEALAKVDGGGSSGKTVISFEAQEGVA